jgi:hypothetical protein
VSYPRYLNEPQPDAALPMDKAAIWIMSLEALRIQIRCGINDMEAKGVSVPHQWMMLMQLDEMLQFMRMSYDAYLHWLGVDSKHQAETAIASAVKASEQWCAHFTAHAATALISAVDAGV